MSASNSSVSHAEQWAVYMELELAEGARFWQKFVAVAETAEGAIDQAIESYECDYPRPRRIEVYPDASAALMAIDFERVKRPRYARRRSDAAHTATTA